MTNTSKGMDVYPQQVLTYTETEVHDTAAAVSP